MSNYVALKRPSMDEHTRALDAICLAECIWWGTGEDMFTNWEHGIYEWRDLCWRLAKWTHFAWEDVREKCGESSWEFDTEFCPALVEYVLASQLAIDPYADEWQVIAEFCRDIVNDHREYEAAEKKRRLIEAQILDRQEEIFMLQNQLEDLSK